MAIKYVVFRQKQEYGWISHKELRNHDDVMLDNDIQNPILRLLNRVHTAARTNKWHQLPWQKIWYKYYLNEELLNATDEMIFMFEDGSRSCFDPNYINYLRSKYLKSHFVFASFNSSFRYPKNRLKMIESTYDLVTSFDRKDCEDRGWFLHTGIYSKLDEYYPDGEYESDVYFAGADKGRLPLIYEIYERLSSAGLKCDFTVTSVKKEDIRPDSGIKFNEWIKYEDVVKKICKTRCLLDIIQPGQDGETYRQGEAVAYGVKLLTNYKNVVKERYYNPRQMEVFTTAEDIDINFITEDYSANDFPYNGCLSPYYRLVRLENYFKNREE